MEMERFIVGNCEAMCPPDEIQLRVRERLVHFYERKRGSECAVDESKMVKEFARSAAGVQSAEARNIRTPAVLKRTIEYLLTEVIADTRRPFNFAYDFIFDRLRAVRQEIVMQNLPETTTVELLEPVCMFLAYSYYGLIEAPIAKFDPKICRQHLQECLKKCLVCYDVLDMSPASESNEKASLRRETIEAMYLLFNLGNSEALTRFIKLPKNIRDRNLCGLSLGISLAHWSTNYYRCLIMMPKLPYLLCAIASLHVQSIRREILLSFSMGYQSKMLMVPLDWLAKVLLFTTVDALTQDCKYYGIQVDHQTRAVKFSKSDFNVANPVVRSRHEQMVENRLHDRIENILLFK